MLSQVTVNIRLVEKLLSDDEDHDDEDHDKEEFTDLESEAAGGHSTDGDPEEMNGITRRTICQK